MEAFGALLRQKYPAILLQAGIVIINLEDHIATLVSDSHI